MMRRYVMAMLCLGLIGRAPAQELRTWTSVSGAMIEARFAGVEQGEIVLENAAGARFSIRPDLLSEADQAYVREAAGGEEAVEPVPTVAPPASAAPRHGGGPRHEKTPPLDSQAIPGLTLQQADEARMIGLQYGPGAQDVVYLIADKSSGSPLHDDLYVYNPRMSGLQQLQKLSTRNRRHEGERYLEAESITLNGQYGATRATHVLTVYSGAVRPDLVWLGIQSAYATGRDSFNVEIRGTINSDARVGPGVIPVIPLAMSIQASLLLNTNSLDNNVFGSLRAGRDFVLTGPRAVFNAITIEARDATGTVVETPRITVREPDDFPTPMTRAYNTTFNRLTRREPYTIVVRVNLGPVLGEVERELSINAR